MPVTASAYSSGRMALKQDERALLQLVCERGQSYADLAELLDTTTDDVKAKARGALTELGGADPDSEVGLTDYLLGQADPIGRADAVRYLQQDSEARELAVTISTKLQALVPDAKLPTIPEPKGRRRSPAPTTPAKPTATDAATGTDAAVAEPGPDVGTPMRRGQRSTKQTQLIAGLAGVGLLLLIVVLAVAGVFSGDDGGPADEQAAAQEQRTITPVELSPRGDSGVAGTANFGTVDTTLFVDLEVRGLDPEPGRRSAYLLWMMINDTLGLPLPSPVTPNANGIFRDQIAIPDELLGVAAAARTVRVGETPTGTLGKAIREAAEQNSPVVAFEGENLAQGRIPPGVGAEVGAGEGAGDTGAGGVGDSTDSGNGSTP
jgi:hypothetical protein